MPKYLVNFAQTKEVFRLPELLALCNYFNTPLSYAPDAYNDNVRYSILNYVVNKCVGTVHGG